MRKTGSQGMGMQTNAKLGNGDVAGMGVWGVLIVGLFFISRTLYLFDIYYIISGV